ncbi:diaminopimelate decarboxylase [candidate division WOR-3 bacterium]|nr:diaminopimelate decarboxylase [candidate division WOR-3 bacterium]
MRFDRDFVRDGRFELEGIGLDSLLEQHATPLYLYSGAVIRDKYRLLSTAFPAFSVHYSLKANPNPEVCRLLFALGAGAEVSSVAELETALRAGAGPERVVFVGPAKTRADIHAAVEAGIAWLVVDSADELAVVDEVGRELGKTVPVLLRINTIEQPEAWETMVGGPSKFGFDEETVVRDVARVKTGSARIAGIQVYSASQVLDPAFLVSHIEYVLHLAGRLVRRIGFELSCIDFGGGFGVPYREEETELDLASVSQAAAQMIEEHRSLLSGARLILESGRFLVAESGVFVTRVVRVKRSRGRVFAITDGGMNAFSRPVVMRVQHPVRLLNRLSAPATTDVDVCGPICTPVDCLARGVRLPDPVSGDVVGFVNAGAYGYTMSLLQFMSLRGPVQLLADSGTLRVV